MPIITEDEKLQNIFIFIHIYLYIFKLDGYLPTELILHQRFNYPQVLAEGCPMDMDSDPLDCEVIIKVTTPCKGFHAGKSMPGSTGCGHAWELRQMHLGIWKHADCSPWGVGWNSKSSTQVISFCEIPEGQRNTSQSTGTEGKGNAVCWGRWEEDSQGKAGKSVGELLPLQQLGRAGKDAPEKFECDWNIKCIHIINYK